MVRQKFTSVDMSTTGFSHSDPSDALDMAAVTALLSVSSSPKKFDQIADRKTEYPLIDETLIIALLSDYTTILSSHIDEVRDQLGILEASLVPDTDIGDALYDDDHSSGLEGSSGGLALDGMDEDLTRMALNDPPPFEDEHPGSPPSASSSHLEAPSRSSRHTQSTSPSGSRTSNATSPTSMVDSDSGFEDDVNLLKSLFPSM